MEIYKDINIYNEDCRDTMQRMKEESGRKFLIIQLMILFLMDMEKNQL